MVFLQKNWNRQKKEVDYLMDLFVNFVQKNNANDFKNVKELIKHVIKIDNDDELYKQYLEQPIFKNKKQASLSSDDKIADRLYEIIEYEKKEIILFKIRILEHNNL